MILNLLMLFIELLSFFNKSKIFMPYASSSCWPLLFIDLVAPKGAVCFARDVNPLYARSPRIRRAS